MSAKQYLVQGNITDKKGNPVVGVLLQAFIEENWIGDQVSDLYMYFMGSINLMERCQIRVVKLN